MQNSIESQIKQFFTEDRMIHAIPLTATEYRPSPAEIVQVLMEHWDESSEVVRDWLMTSDFSEVEV